MKLDAAFSLFGLDHEATVADLKARYRALRKPLLKRLNRAAPGAEPKELVNQLEGVETAFKLLLEKLEKGAAEAAKKPHSRRSTGRVTLETGAVLLGRYEIRGLAAHRPEGDTYRVFDTIRRTELGLKIVDEALLRGKGARALLHRGLLDANRLNHPGLVRVLDIHRLQHTYAVTQELPSGTPLWDLLHGDEATRKQLTPAKLVRVAKQATHALAYVHTLMPHATLRPESIWVTETGDARVGDLGFVTTLQVDKLNVYSIACKAFEEDVLLLEVKFETKPFVRIDHESRLEPDNVGRKVGIVIEIEARLLEVATEFDPYPLRRGNLEVRKVGWRELRGYARLRQERQVEWKRPLAIEKIDVE